MSDASERQGAPGEPFERAYARVAGSIHVLAAALVGRSDAADVVQEACIVALRRYGTFWPGGAEENRRAGDFRAWMAAIVRNVASNHRRGERRRTARLRVWSRLSGAAEGRAGAVDASNGGQGIDPALLEAVDSLDEDARVCLLLRVVQGHSYEEIGATLQMPEGTVRSHVFRARKRLLQRLESNQKVGHE